MNPLDWVLVVLVVAYALSGYWQGFVTGAFATAGLLLGGLVGIWLAPVVLGDTEPSVWVSLGALFIVILTASLGQALLQWAGARVRDHITWQPARYVDAVGGAALSAVAVLVVAWALGVAIAGSQLGTITPLVRSSSVLAKVNEVLPDQTSQVLHSFDDVVGSTFFPDYLEPFAPERIVRVGPGPRRMLTDPDVVDAESSVLKIRSINSCNSGVEGTGFVYAPDHIMTNAHVVAGVREPQVLVGDRTVPATVVVYDPDLDLAVLRLDTGGLDPLEFSFRAQRRDPVAVLGYPEDGPYDVQPGRIRSQQRLRSANIYGDSTVLREVYSVRGLIRPGNSGGPVVDSGGDVVGVVFAASVTDADTGYALTSDQVRERAAQGLTSQRSAFTGPCTR